MPPKQRLSCIEHVPITPPHPTSPGASPNRTRTTSPYCHGAREGDGGGADAEVVQEEEQEGGGQAQVDRRRQGESFQVEETEAALKQKSSKTKGEKVARKRKSSE